MFFLGILSLLFYKRKENLSSDELVKQLAQDYHTGTNIRIENSLTKN